MRYLVWCWVPVFALLMLPLAGCSSTTTEGDGGEGGVGGVFGSPSPSGPVHCPTSRY